MTELVPVINDDGYLIAMQRKRRCPVCRLPIGADLHDCPPGAQKLPLKLPKANRAAASPTGPQEL